MKKLLKVSLIISSLIGIMFLFNISVSAETAGGTCGADANWSLDENGVLTISGSGNMTDFTTTSKVSWASNKDDIVKVVIDEGITKIGKNSFRDCSGILEISLPESLEIIGENSFRNCVALEDITLPDSVTTIGASAFRGCEALLKVKIGNGLASVGTEAFSGCVSLAQIKLPISLVDIGDDIFADCSELVIDVYYDSAAMSYCNDYDYKYIAICTVGFYSEEVLLNNIECAFGESIILPQISVVKEGYDFYGWEIGGVTYNPDDSLSVKENLVANALWKVKTYNIIFETNGGNNPQPVVKQHGQSITLPVAEKEGYDHIGWTTLNGSDSAQYKAGDQCSLNENAVLYAVWKMKTYIVKFDANGGSADIADHIKRYWEKLQITDVVPVMSGSTFMGWGIDPEAVVARYQPGDLVSDNEDITLYAIWKSGITLGDANNNGTVDVADLMFMMKRINNHELSLTDDNKLAMDVYRDTYFNVKDILILAQYLSGWTNVVLGE